MVRSLTSRVSPDKTCVALRRRWRAEDRFGSRNEPASREGRELGGVAFSVTSVWA